MAVLIQLPTQACLYDGPFGGQAGWPAAGMSYVIVTACKRLIVIDGGHGEDAESLLSYLEATTHAKPCVDVWIITHPHKDHYGALLEIASHSELSSRVAVKEVLYHFPANFRNARGKPVCEGAENALTQACLSLGACPRAPHTGEDIRLDDVALTFLFCPTSEQASKFKNPNSLSLIFTIQGLRRRVMMTGDACPLTMQFCMDTYGETLACDVLQIPHHGLCDTGHEGFYSAVKAKELLIPISVVGDRAMKSGEYGEATRANDLAVAQAEILHLAYRGVCEIEI